MPADSAAGGYSLESLGRLRAAIGVALLLFQPTQYYALLTLYRSEVSFSFLEPVWYIDLLGIERHEPLASLLAFIVLMIATVAVMVGYRSKIAIAAVIVLNLYLKGVRDSLMGDTHHRLLMPFCILVLLLLSPSSQRYSLDRRMGRTASSGEDWQAHLAIVAMQVYMATFYLWSAMSKLRVSGSAWFVDGGKLQEILVRRSAMWGVGEDGIPLGNALAFHLASEPALLTAMALSVLVLEASFPLVLILRSPRNRALFLGAIAVFHVLSFVFLYVGFVLMPLFFVVFFDLAQFGRDRKVVSLP